MGRPADGEGKTPSVQTRMRVFAEHFFLESEPDSRFIAELTAALVGHACGSCSSGERRGCKTII